MYFRLLYANSFIEDEFKILLYAAYKKSTNLFSIKVFLIFANFTLKSYRGFCQISF